MDAATDDVLALILVGLHTCKSWPRLLRTVCRLSIPVFTCEIYIYVQKANFVVSSDDGLWAALP